MPYACGPAKRPLTVVGVLTTERRLRGTWAQRTPDGTAESGTDGGAGTICAFQTPAQDQCHDCDGADRDLDPDPACGMQTRRGAEDRAGPAGPRGEDREAAGR